MTVQMAAICTRFGSDRCRFVCKTYDQWEKSGKDPDLNGRCALLSAMPRSERLQVHPRPLIVPKKAARTRDRKCLAPLLQVWLPHRGHSVISWCTVFSACILWRTPSCPSGGPISWFSTISVPFSSANFRSSRGWPPAPRCTRACRTWWRSRVASAGLSAFPAPA